MMDIRAMINRLVNGGWNYPQKNEVEDAKLKAIDSLTKSLAIEQDKYAKLSYEYDTLARMYAELKNEPEAERLRKVVEELNTEFDKIQQAYNEEFSSAYNRGFNDGRACVYGELGLELLAEAEIGKEEEEIDLDDLDTEDDIEFVFGEPIKELNELCESLYR